MSFFVQRSDVSEFRRRFRWIALGMALAFLGLIARLFYVQVIEGEENKAIAHENIVRRVTLATTRGILHDRNGKVLAASRPAYNVYVVPSRLDMANTWPKPGCFSGIVHAGEPWLPTMSRITFRPRAGRPAVRSAKRRSALSRCSSTL